MDLIFWRHAHAQDPTPGGNDLQRALTSRGEKQAARMAAWLDRRLPDATRILCSPALRCEQTVAALGRKYRVSPELAPGKSAAEILNAMHWPNAKLPIMVVGHQPGLGEAIANLLQMPANSAAIRKGAVWWLRSRERDTPEQIVVVAVQSPDAV